MKSAMANHCAKRAIQAGFEHDEPVGSGLCVDPGCGGPVSALRRQRPRIRFRAGSDYAH